MPKAKRTPVRKNVSPKLRFEVFKRDGFACQYCGGRAPDVVLRCDHITPVASGGGNEILNLITACQDCNSGKGKVEITDCIALEKQQKTLEQMQRNRDELDRQLAIRENLKQTEAAAVESVVVALFARTGIEITESGKIEIRKWLKRYPLADILTSVDVSFDHMGIVAGTKCTRRTAIEGFDAVPRLAARGLQDREKPYLQKLAYIQGILRNRTDNRNLRCIRALEAMHISGISLEDLTEASKAYSTWEDFCSSFGWEAV